MKKKLVSLFLVLLMCLSLIPVLGTEASAEGSQQQAMIDAAKLHIGNTAENFPAVKFDWCVYFINYCANEVGLASPESSPKSKLFPPITNWKDNDWAATGVTYQANWFTKYGHGKLYYFKDSSLIEKNKNTIKTGPESFTPIPGDLIYIHHPQSNSVYNHVALVYDYDEVNRIIYYIGGNQGSYDWRYSDVSCREISLDPVKPSANKKDTEEKDPDEIAGFLRPNYTTKYERPQGQLGMGPATGTVCTYSKNCPSAAFKDVMPNVWYHQSLDYCVVNNLFKGTSDTTFSPNATMTRGMMITVLYRLDGSPDVSKLDNPFKDVNDKTWCIDAIKWAYDTGVTEGYADKTFGTDIKITRAQAAKMLYCFALYKNLDCSKTKDYKNFADAKDVGSWADPAIKWALGNGIIQGVTETKLNPNGSATRAQLAAILARYAQNFDIFNIEEKPEITPMPSATPEPTATQPPEDTTEATQQPESEETSNGSGTSSLSDLIKDLLTRNSAQADELSEAS